MDGLPSPVKEKILNTLMYHFRNSSFVAMVSRRDTESFIQDLLQLLFPHFAETKCVSPIQLDGQLDILAAHLNYLLHPIQSELETSKEHITTAFFEQLPDIYNALLQDARCLYHGDPAATSVDEVIIAYPGFYAIAIYRIAHALHCLGVPVIPRLLSEFAHQRTGIDIHPGAKIGGAFCMDHGTGIVIGETTEIGNCVKLYQGVTLGALSVEKHMALTKRHPTIQDRVIIYAGATILGGDTVVGHDTIIGGNVWLTESVPPSSIVYHQSQIQVRQHHSDSLPVTCLTQ